MKQVTLYTATGRADGKIKLPEKLFGQKVNAQLLAQALRVYQWREHKGRAKTKTRSEVRATGAKWYRQKGTGRARHGARSAPIFTGGGVAHGPRGIRRPLGLTKKLAHAALFSALSDKLGENKIFLVDVSRFGEKTKNAASFFKKLGLGEGALVLHGGEENFVRASRNLPGVSLLPANKVNAYQVLRNPALVVTKLGLGLLMETLVR